MNQLKEMAKEMARLRATADDTNADMYDRVAAKDDLDELDCKFERLLRKVASETGITSWKLERLVSC
jgi:hypothetical protein